MMMLAEAATFIGGQLIGEDLDFSNLSINTRTIQQGDVFLAIKGENFDAHNFLLEAEKLGACAVITERENDVLTIPQIVVGDSVKALGLLANLKRSKLSAQVVAITGSSGKTTVKGLLKSICDNAGLTAATKGNLNNHIGVPLTLMGITENTEYAIVEAGTSSKGEIAYLEQIINPDIALLNNVMPAHLGGFGSIEAIAKEKQAIYGGDDSLSIAIVNIDDGFSSNVLALLGDRTKIVFGRDINKLQTSCDGLNNCQHLGANILEKDEFGRCVIELVFNSQSYPCRLSIIGEHNVSNALAASACAIAMEIGFADIVSGIERFSGEPGRMQLNASKQCSILVDDTYNANPGSVKEAINWLSQFKESVLILGDMGELGEKVFELHQEVGRYASEKKLKTVCAVGEYAQDVIKNCDAKCFAFNDKSELFSELKNILNQDSVVLVKGSRGAKMETVVHEILESGK